jgi:hypothetical protein
MARHESALCGQVIVLVILKRQHLKYIPDPGGLPAAIEQRACNVMKNFRSEIRDLQQRRK